MAFTCFHCLQRIDGKSIKINIEAKLPEDTVKIENKNIPVTVIAIGSFVKSVLII